MISFNVDVQNFDISKKNLHSSGKIILTYRDGSEEYVKNGLPISNVISFERNEREFCCDFSVTIRSIPLLTLSYNVGPGEGVSPIDLSDAKIMDLMDEKALDEYISRIDTDYITSVSEKLKTAGMPDEMIAQFQRIL